MSQDFSKAKIYKITNDYNNDVYVGSTCDLLTKRFSGHKSNLLTEEKKDRPLYKLMNKIGLELSQLKIILVKINMNLDKEKVILLERLVH